MFDPAILPELDCDTSPEIQMSELLTGLSYALDLAEGHTEGHAVRTCLIGMRIAEELKLTAGDRSALYYALLLKDLGGSSNAAKVSYLFGADDRTVKRNLQTVDWGKLSETVHFMTRNVMPDGSPMQRALRAVVCALEGTSAPARLVKTRCEKGASLVRHLGFSEETAIAILHLDEHWDGRGNPWGLKWEDISLLARIACLAQKVEVFFSAGGPRAAVEMARDRRGTWFDPAIVDAFDSFARDIAFWSRVSGADQREEVIRAEPEAQVLMANEATVDRVSRAFAQVVDAKSPWTYRHSENVARIAVGMANVLGLSADAVSRVYRAGLLHDLGKLGVSNLILDKAGSLTSEEYVEVRRHPELTHQVLSRVASFQEIAEIAAAHHERLDGRGYHRGLAGAELPIEARLLVVADMSEALAARRAYRDAMPREKVYEILDRDAGTAVCCDCVSALKRYHDRSDTISRVNDQLNALESLMENL